jgi:signal transduction histidine kinase
MATDSEPAGDAPFLAARRRARGAATLFLLVHPLYSALQLVSLLLVPLPPAIDRATLAWSFVANVALDLGVGAYLGFVILSPRLGVRAARLLTVASSMMGIALMGVWVVQTHLGGTQSSQTLLLVLGTAVVFAWLLPPRAAVGLAVATAALLCVVVGLELRGDLPYAPLLAIGPQATALFLDWRVVLMNLAIFAATLILVVAVLLRLRAALRTSRRRQRESLVRLEREVVEREHAEETLRRAVEELSARNETISTFVRGFAHDLRSPLAAAGGFAALAKEDLPRSVDEGCRECLDGVEESVSHMTRLLEDLTRLVRTRRTDTPSAPCDAGRVLRRVLAFLDEPLRRSGGRVEAGPLPVVLADETRLTQVLQNLVGNALKYRGEAPPWVRVTATAEDGAWRFDVRDNGIGFDPADADRMFRPFVRLVAADQFPGDGIGLSVCRTLVQSMGGTIGARPEPDGGSTFWFTLPAVPAAVEPREQRGAP